MKIPEGLYRVRGIRGYVPLPRALHGIRVTQASIDLKLAAVGIATRDELRADDVARALAVDAELQATQRRNRHKASARKRRGK